MVQRNGVTDPRIQVLLSRLPVDDRELTRMILDLVVNPPPRPAPLPSIVAIPGTFNRLPLRPQNSVVDFQSGVVTHGDGFTTNFQVPYKGYVAHSITFLPDD